MKEQNVGSNKMVPIIIVVVMVSLIVVIGFFGMMYIFAWDGDLSVATDDDNVESEKYTEDGTEIPFMDDDLKLNVEDDRYSPGEEGESFLLGNAIFKIEQTGGYPIYWDYLNFEALNVNSGDAVELVVLEVNGVDVKNSTKPADEIYMTETGFMLRAGLKYKSDEGVLHSGDDIKVYVYSYYKSQKLFESREFRIS